MGRSEPQFYFKKERYFMKKFALVWHDYEDGKTGFAIHNVGDMTYEEITQKFGDELIGVFTSRFTANAVCHAIEDSIAYEGEDD
jgi:hypothetical protein